MQNIILKMTANVRFIFVKNTFFLFVTFLQNLCIKLRLVNSGQDFLPSHILDMPKPIYVTVS